MNFIVNQFYALDVTLNNNEMLDLKDAISMLGTEQKLAQEMIIVEKHLKDPRLF